MHSPSVAAIMEDTTARAKKKLSEKLRLVAVTYSDCAGCWRRVGPRCCQQPEKITSSISTATLRRKRLNEVAVRTPDLVPETPRSHTRVGNASVDLGVA